jgi:acetyl esterase
MADLKDRRSALASPRWYIEPEQARRQPRTLIVSAEVDPSRDDGEGFGQVLQGFGVEVGILRMQGVVHDGLVWEAVRGGETAKVAIGAVVGGIKRAFGEVEDGKGEREVVTRKRKSEEKEEGKERKTRRQKKRGVKL